MCQCDWLRARGRRVRPGLSPKTVQTFAAHSGLQVTMERYDHLFKSNDHKKAKAAIANDMSGDNKKLKYKENTSLRLPLSENMPSFLTKRLLCKPLLKKS
jgi:hypothetical protein